MVFREIQFPPKYSKGARGGEQFKTRVLENQGGIEDRNIRWENTRGTWDVSHLLKDLDQSIELKAFWMAVGYGKAYGFRFKWWGDFCADMIDWKNAVNVSDGVANPTSIDTLPLIGVGDSTDGIDGTGDFQIVKPYIAGAYTYTKIIYKPVTGTVRVWLDNIETTDFTVDSTTGVVSFTAGNNPLTGEIIRAWYEYDLPVRFASDINEVLLDAQAFDNQDWPEIGILELKNAA